MQCADLMVLPVVCADVVTPNIPPHEMSALLKAEEEHSADIAQGIIDVQASS
jgi:hypothetical protein